MVHGLLEIRPKGYISFSRFLSCELSIKFQEKIFYIKTLNIGTDRSEQTVQIQIRLLFMQQSDLLFMDQSDLRLHHLPFHLHGIIYTVICLSCCCCIVVLHPR